VGFFGFSDFVDFCAFFNALTWIFHSGNTATLMAAGYLSMFTLLLSSMSWDSWERAVMFAIA